MFNVIDVMSVSSQRVDESTFDHLHSSRYRNVKYVYYD